MNGVAWCRNPAGTPGESCNAVCASVGGVPISNDAVWTAAQDTPAECTAIRDAFGYVEPVVVALFEYACSEREPGVMFICSPYSGCPASHRAGSDTTLLGICPCEWP